MNKMTGAEIVRDMSRDDFYRNIIKGVARTHEFSTLIMAGPSALTEAEKDLLRNGLSGVGITHDMTASDYDLTEVAVEIAGRSVTLK